MPCAHMHMFLTLVYVGMHLCAAMSAHVQECVQEACGHDRLATWCHRLGGGHTHPSFWADPQVGLGDLSGVGRRGGSCVGHGGRRQRENGSRGCLPGSPEGQRRKPRISGFNFLSKFSC